MANYKMVTVPILRDVSDAPRNLYEILKDFMENELIKPPHQRGKVWSDNKIEGWIHRLTGKYSGDENYVKPVGTIVTYQLASGSVVFINDGYQRLNATRDFYLNPENYGFQPEDATQILKALEVPVQHRIYSTHEEAMLDFQFLNIGTSLTTFEFFHGVIAYLPNYEHAIKDILDDVHEGIDLASERVCSKTRKDRKLIQKRKRHNYSLLFKYITQDRSKKQYKIASSDVKEFSKKAQEECIETLIRGIIEQLGKKNFSNKSKQFIRFIDAETMKIKEVWEGKCNTPIAAGITHATYRWLLDISIWKKYNKKSDEQWENFLFLLFTNFKGKTVLTSGDNHEQITLSLGSTSKVKKVCEVIGSDLDGKIKRPPPDTQFAVRPGADQSHIDPDEKKVIPESSGRNRARGRRKMTDEEESALYRHQSDT